MSEFVIVIVGIVMAAIGFALGRGSGRAAGLEHGRREGRDEGLEAGRTEARAQVERDLRAIVDAVSRGKRPQSLPGGGPVAELIKALETGWAPREQERQSALREAVGRVSAFLDRAVRSPLAEASPSEDAAGLYERIERAVGSLQDLDFFVKDPPLDGEGHDLAQLVQRVTREFAQDQKVGIRMALDGRPVKAKVNPTTFMDAVYLLLHNAARFGGGATVDVAVVTESGAARVRVRDRGRGFSEEAFQRAFDPFYSTTEDGLGLGLPHARRVIEGMGGTIELRNLPDGGGEVEVTFPSA